MDKVKIVETLARITAADPRFSVEAYEFIGAAVNKAIAEFAESEDGGKRHITGAELLDVIRVGALEAYGPMAKTVFNHWGLHDTMDIGHVVFNMVDNKLLCSSENDSIEDFRDVFDFESAFVEPFLPGADLYDTEIEAIDL